MAVEGTHARGGENVKEKGKKEKEREKKKKKVSSMPDQEIENLFDLDSGDEEEEEQVVREEEEEEEDEGRVVRRKKKRRERRGEVTKDDIDVGRRRSKREREKDEEKEKEKEKEKQNEKEKKQERKEKVTGAGKKELYGMGGGMGGGMMGEKRGGVGRWFAAESFLRSEVEYCQKLQELFQQVFTLFFIFSCCFSFLFFPPFPQANSFFLLLSDPRRPSFPFFSSSPQLFSSPPFVFCGTIFPFFF